MNVTQCLHRWPAAVWLLALAAVAGCQPEAPTVDADRIAQHRQELLLTEEPEGAVTVLDLREQDGGFSEGEVVLVGQVGGMPNPWQDTEKHFPWVDGEASFYLVDPATAAEFADHAHAEDDDHHENCPFCARAAAKSVDAIAAVTFNGGDGKPIPIGAGQLFGLNAEDVVVVRGVGKLLAGNLLVVEADGLYLRR